MRSATAASGALQHEVLTPPWAWSKVLIVTIFDDGVQAPPREPRGVKFGAALGVTPGHGAREVNVAPLWGVEVSRCPVVPYIEI